MLAEDRTDEQLDELDGLLGFEDDKGEEVGERVNESRDPDQLAKIARLGDIKTVG